MARAVTSGVTSLLTNVRGRLLRRETSGSVMLALGAVVGLATGLSAALLVAVIRVVQGAAWGVRATPIDVVVVPTVGAFVVGLLLRYGFPESRGSGIVRVMSTIALHSGRFRGRVPLGGVVATGVALGTGASGGREGPIVLIGGAIGSLVGRLFAVGEQRMRTLLAAGAAAGIGASFNAPIGGMLFAIEVIIGGFRASSLQVVVVSAVVGSVTAREIIGPDIAYRPALPYALGAPVELLLYALVGLGAVAVGLGFVHGEETVARLTGRLRLWLPLQLALGGLGVGLLALVVPEVLGTGEHLPPIDGVREPIQRMLDGGFGLSWTAVSLLLLLLVAKILATSLSVGTGNAVGTFAPSLFTGAALGGAIGTTAALTMPGLGIQPGSFALVGMAAVFTVVGRAPLTSILIAFELTGDYGLVLPLMLAVGVAAFLADRVQPESMYERALRSQGIVYSEPEDVDVMQTVTVREVMSPPVPLPASAPLPVLLDAMADGKHRGFPVVDDGRLVGVVTVTDLSKPDAAGLDELTVGDICTRPPVTVTPDDPMFRALRRMATLDVGRLPVVAADDHSRLVGMVRRRDVVTAYQRALARSLGVQQTRTASRLRDLAGTHVVELVVDPDGEVAGRQIRDVDWPPRTIVATIRRGDEILAAAGDTTLQADDALVVLTSADCAEDVRRLVAGLPGRA